MSKAIVHTHARYVIDVHVYLSALVLLLVVTTLYA